MLKRIFSIVLAVCMLIGMLSVNAFAESDYKYSKIAYYKDGSEVTGLTAGDITAKIKVKSATKTDELFFAVLLYKNNKLTDASIDETPAAVESTAVQYDATMTVPADLTGVKLVSVLWESAKSMEPVCSSSIVPSSEVGLSSLTVDGVAIEGFDTAVYSYEVALTEEQIARSSAPWIGYTAFDNGVNVEVTDPTTFLGASTVKVTAGESSVTYTINYTADVTSMVEVSATYSDSTTDPPVVSILSADTVLVPNRNFLRTWCSPELYGQTYVSFGAGQTGTTISLKRSGNISTYATPGLNKQTEANGWTIDEKGWDTGAENNWANDTVCSCTAHAEEHSAYGACYCVLDANGACTGTSRIGNGLDEFPAECMTGSNVNDSAWEKKYDVRKQGWFYLYYRDTQKYRKHEFGAFSIKATKHFNAGEEQTFGQGGSGLGTPITVDFDGWTPAVNPDTDLEL